MNTINFTFFYSISVPKTSEKSHRASPNNHIANQSKKYSARQNRKERSCKKNVEGFAKLQAKPLLFDKKKVSVRDQDPKTVQKV